MQCEAKGGRKVQLGTVARGRMQSSSGRRRRVIWRIEGQTERRRAVCHSKNRGRDRKKDNFDIVV